MLVAKTIPYKDFKEKIEIVSKELSKNRKVEVWDKHKMVYSADRRRFNDEG